MSDFLSAVGEIATNGSAYRNAAIAAVDPRCSPSLGELVAEKAGSINISLEGMMLGGAFAAAIGQDLTGSVWVGVACSMLAGMAVSWVQANMSHRLPADQFVVGLVLNVLVLGVVGFLAGEIDPTTNIVGRTKIPVLVRDPADRPGAVRPAVGDLPGVPDGAADLVPRVPHPLGPRGPRRRRGPERGRRVGPARQQAAPPDDLPRRGSPPAWPARCCCSPARVASRTRSSAGVATSRSPP